MSVGDPVESMARRLAVSTEQAGIGSNGQAQIQDAFLCAVQVRKELDARDPALLHPARTVLILLNDARVRDPDVLSAAALAESEDLELAVAEEELQRRFNPRTAGLVAGVPRPALCGETLLEALLTAEEAVQRIAVAERLDHARHLHLRPAALWSDQFDTINQAYLPVAERVDATLGRRLRWWCGMFPRQYLNR